MTEQELREKIARWLFTFVRERESLVLNWEQTESYYYQEADNLIQEVLPELAKEAGYVKPTDIPDYELVGDGDKF